MCDQTIYQVSYVRHDDSHTVDISVTLTNAPWSADPIVDLSGLPRACPVTFAFAGFLYECAKLQMQAFDRQ